MAVQFGAEDLLLLGYKSAHVEALAGRAGFYTARAELVLGASKIEHDYLYVPSGATVDELQAVYNQTFRTGYSPTLITSESGLSPNTLKKIFPRSEIQNLGTLLWKKVHEGFSGYLDSLRTNVVLPEVYVAPRGDLESPREQVDQFVLDSIKSNNGSFILLKAPAGVGKTTVSRHLAREVARQSGTAAHQRKIIPILIESAHWAKQIGSLDSLFQVVENSVRQFARDEGGILVSQRLFDRALARGYFLIVFDGFDEFFSSSTILDANETIDDLVDFAVNGEAKIVVTSRSQFWDTVVDGDKVGSVTTVEMLPFNKQQATSYIDQFFKSDRENFEKAKAAYSLLAGDGIPRNTGGPRAQFSNLPVCVSMLCDAIRSGVEINSSSVRPMDYLLQAICEREKKRQQLENTASEQLAAFKELALQGAEFEEEYLEIAGLTDGRKLESHPLLLKQGNLVSFKYDFLGPYFQSEAFYNAIFEAATLSGDAKRRLERLSDGKSPVFDHMASFFEVVPSMDDYVSKISAFVSRNALQQNISVRGFLAHLGQVLAKSHRDCKNSKDRFKFVFGGLVSPNGNFEFVEFCGVYDSIDFSGRVLSDCAMRSVILRSCGFASTQFVRCRLEAGVEFEPSEHGISAEQLVNCAVKGDTGLSFISNSSSVETIEELAKDLLDAGLSKFWHNGRFKATIRINDWSKGVLSRSRFRDELLSCLKKNSFVSVVEISGIADSGLAYDRGALRELQAFMDHRLLTGRLHAVFECLLSKLK